MKYSQLLLGFIAGCCFFFMISAKPGANEVDGVPRYHITTLTGMNYIRTCVYDAVTGKYRLVNVGEFKSNTNLEEVLSATE